MVLSTKIPNTERPRNCYKISGCSRHEKYILQKSDFQEKNNSFLLYHFGGVYPELAKALSAAKGAVE